LDCELILGRPQRDLLTILRAWHSAWLCCSSFRWS